MAVVVGFLSYEDFVAELAQSPPEVVRLQDYYRRTVERGSGIPSVRFLIEAAVAQNGLSACNAQAGATLVCRFDMGGGMAFEKEERQQDQENSHAAMRLLTTDLAKRGFTVRPGVIAATKESDTTATCGLWRFEERVLVAVSEEPG